MCASSSFFRVSRLFASFPFALAVLSFAAAAPGFAANPPPPADILAALDRLDATDLSAYSFLAERTREGSTQTLRYAAGPRGERDVTLLAVDGREPTAEEREAVAEEQRKMREARAEQEKERKKEGRSEEHEEENGSNLREMITPGTLEFVRDDAEGAHFRFVPRFAIEGEPEPQKDLRGKLIYDRAIQSVRSLEIRNEGVFKPRFGVKLTELHLLFQFAPLADGILAPSTISTTIKGKAFLLAGFDQSEKTVFHDYQRAGGEAEAK